MEYIPFERIPYFMEAAALTAGLGFRLVDLKFIRSRGSAKVSAVIAPLEAGGAIGTEDCAKVHRALQIRLEALSGLSGFPMEVASPGMERSIKNAAEFALFTGRRVKVWDTRRSDWVNGVISRAGEAEIALTLGADGSGGGETAIPFEFVAKAKLLD